MPPKTAEEQLKEVATASGKTMREIFLLVDQNYRDDENYSKRVLTAKQTQVNAKQLALMEVQIHNEVMREMLLQRSLNRRVWQMRQIEKFKSLWTRKKKA